MTVNRLLQLGNVTVLRSTTVVNVQTASTLWTLEHHSVLYLSTVIWRLMEEDGRFVSVCVVIFTKQTVAVICRYDLFRSLCLSHYDSSIRGIIYKYNRVLPFMYTVKRSCSVLFVFLLLLLLGRSTYVGIPSKLLLSVFDSQPLNLRGGRATLRHKYHM